MTRRLGLLVDEGVVEVGIRADGRRGADRRHGTTVVSMVARDIPELMAGRAVQGVGLAGMIPLGMALISTAFSARERGRSLGTWSSIGPASGFVGPLLAGFIVAAFG